MQIVKKQKISCLAVIVALNTLSSIVVKVSKSKKKKQSILDFPLQHEFNSKHTQLISKGELSPTQHRLLVLLLLLVCLQQQRRRSEDGGYLVCNVCEEVFSSRYGADVIFLTDRRNTRYIYMQYVKNIYIFHLFCPTKPLKWYEN